MFFWKSTVYHLSDDPFTFLLCAEMHKTTPKDTMKKLRVPTLEYLTALRL